jgi:two-component system, NarL family, response regulator NreC
LTRPTPSARRRRPEANGPGSEPAREPWRLLLVDSHPIFRLGLRALLDREADFTVLGDVGTTEDLYAMLAREPVDIIVTELALPGTAGLDLIEHLRTRHPDVPLLVLSDCAGYEYARAAFVAGAAGFTPKGGSHAELLEAIRTVAGGERYVNSDVASKIVVDYLGNLAGGPDVRAAPVITRRERDVLTRVAAGHGNREIAEQLGLSIWTVRKHRQNLMQKFSLHNSAAITAFAISNGLVPAHPNLTRHRS